MTGSHRQFPVFMIVPATARRATSADLQLFSFLRNTTALPVVAYQLIPQLKSFLGAAAARCPPLLFHHLPQLSDFMAAGNAALQLCCLVGLCTPVTAKLGLNSPPTLHPWSSCTPSVTTLSWHNKESLLQNTDKNQLLAAAPQNYVMMIFLWVFV